MRITPSGSSIVSANARIGAARSRQCLGSFVFRDDISPTSTAPGRPRVDQAHNRVSDLLVRLLPNRSTSQDS